MYKRLWDRKKQLVSVKLSILSLNKRGSLRCLFCCSKRKI